MARRARHITLLPSTTITTAITAQASTGVPIGDAVTISLEAKFVYGSGGTTTKVWVQTTLDGGVTWIDIANFAFTTASASKVSVINSNPATPLAAGTTPGAAALADNTIVNGIIGDQIRTLTTTTGTYAGGTTLEVHAVVSTGGS